MNNESHELIRRRHLREPWSVSVPVVLASAFCILLLAVPSCARQRNQAFVGPLVQGPVVTSPRNITQRVFVFKSDATWSNGAKSMHLTASDLTPKWSDGDVVVASYVDGTPCPFDRKASVATRGGVLRVNAVERRPAVGQGCPASAHIYPVAFTVHSLALPRSIHKLEVLSSGISAGTVSLQP